MRNLTTTALIVMGLFLGAGTATAQTSSSPPLSPARSDALLPVIDYAQILDAIKPAPAKISRYAAACRKLPATDRLIVAFRSVCRSEGDAFTAGLRLPACGSAPRCIARLNRYAADVVKQRAASVKFNTLIKTEVTDTDCRSALRIRQAVLLTLARLRTGALNVVGRVRSGTAAQVSRAVAVFYSIDRSPLLDHRGRLDTFRAACR